MKKLCMILSVWGMGLTMTACGGSGSDHEPVPTPKKPATETAAVPVANTPVKKPSVDAQLKDVVYRDVSATLQGSDQKIMIKVPENIEVESGQLLEYRLADDGTYYYKSTIPQ